MNKSDIFQVKASFKADNLKKMFVKGHYCLVERVAYNNSFMSGGIAYYYPPTVVYKVRNLSSPGLCKEIDEKNYNWIKVRVSAAKKIPDEIRLQVELLELDSIGYRESDLSEG